MGNLSHCVSVTEETEQLKQLFANYGKVQEVKVLKGRRYGFVKMSSPSEAKKAKKELNEKAYTRFNAKNLAALSRISARDSAMKVVSEGLRWIGGLIPESEAVNLEKKLCIPQINRAQAGLIQDMDYIADVLYERDEA